MSYGLHNASTRVRSCGLQLVLGTLLAVAPGIGTTEILWSGDFDDGNLLKWNHYDPNPMEIWGIPRYGTAVQYGGQHSSFVGNGDLIWLTADENVGNFRKGPRLGKHALGLHVKSWNGGSVDAQSTDAKTPGDWDGSVSTRRRTELRGMPLHFQNNLVPYMTTRWASASIFLPSDWDSVNGSGWGPVTWQWKPQKHGSAMSGPIELSVRNGYWEFRLRRNKEEDPKDSGWNSIIFNPSLRSSEFYPNASESTAALGNLNKGAWTHFVMQLRLDGRTNKEGGTGFIRLWMRHGDAAWVHVVDYYPTEEYGVLFKQSGDGTNWGFHASLYMENKQVLDLPGPGRTLFYDNLKIGSENATFADMSHDGASPGSEGMPPQAPVISVE